MNSSARAQALGVGMSCVSCIVLCGLAGQVSPMMRRKQQLELEGAMASTTIRGAAGYTFYLLEMSVFLGSCPSCHYIIMVSFLTLLSLPAAVILLGMTPGSQLGNREGLGPGALAPTTSLSLL